MPPIDYQALGRIGILHLCFFGLYIPWAAIRAGKKLADPAHYPPRKKHFRSTLITQVLLGAISVWVANSEWIDVFAPHAITVKDVVMGAVALAAFTFAMARRWKWNVDQRVATVELFSPRDATERTLWIFISIVATSQRAESLREIPALRSARRAV